MLDCAALWRAFAPSTAPVVEARLCLRRGFTALRPLAETLGLDVDVDDDPDPDAPLLLREQEYLDGMARTATTTFHMKAPRCRRGRPLAPP